MPQSDLESSDEQPRSNPAEGEQDGASSLEEAGEQRGHASSSVAGVPRPMNWNQTQLTTIRTSLGAKRLGLDFLQRNSSHKQTADLKTEPSPKLQPGSHDSGYTAPNRNSPSSVLSQADDTHDKNKDNSILNANEKDELDSKYKNEGASTKNQGEVSSTGSVLDGTRAHKSSSNRLEEVESTIPCAPGTEPTQASTEHTNYESSTEEDTSDYEDDKGVVLNIISDDNSDLESGEIEDGEVRDDASMDISDQIEDGEIDEEENSSGDGYKAISNGYESSEEGEVTDDTDMETEDEDEDEYDDEDDDEDDNDDDSETGDSSDGDDMMQYADSNATGKHATSNHGLSKKRRKLSEAEKAAWARFSDEEKLRDGRMRPNPVVIGHLGREDLRFHLNTYFALENPGEVSPLELVFCKLCFKRGHLIDYPCPRLTCDTCGAFAQHVTRDCSLTRVCMKCRQQGHDAWDCTFPKQVTPDEVPCWYCTRPGHWEQNCETLWSTPPYRFEKDADPEIVKNYGCYSCGGKGHLGNDCPRREPGKPMGTSLWSAKAWSLPHPTSGRHPPTGSKDANDGIIYPGPSGFVMASQRWHKKTMYLWEEDSRHKSSAYYYPKESRDRGNEESENEIERVGKRKNLEALPTRGHGASKVSSRIKIATPSGVPGSKSEMNGGRGGNQSTTGRDGGAKTRGGPETSRGSSKSRKRPRASSPHRPRDGANSQGPRGGLAGPHRSGGGNTRSQKPGDGGGRGGRGGGRGGGNSRGSTGSKGPRGGGQRHVPMPSSAANAWRRFRS